MVVVTDISKKSFKPITVSIVLQSQDEVNALFSVGNYSGQITDLIEKGCKKDAMIEPNVSRNLLFALYTALVGYKKF